MIDSGEKTNRLKQVKSRTRPFESYLTTLEVREAAASAKMASEQLLIAQLKCGQHSLPKDKFWKTVNELRSRGCKL